jgi:hypothetical protein
MATPRKRCTPSGRNYSVRLTGGAPARVWSDMDNKPFTLSTYTRGAFSSQHTPPELRLKGRWSNATPRNLLRT